MVSIGKNVSGLNNLGVSQPSVGKAKQTQVDSKKDFSKVLTTKTQTPNQQTQQLQNEAVTYSPLMQNYGVNKIREIKDIANSYGINDLTNQDFDNAIRYGRSIIADYIV